MKLSVGEVQLRVKCCSKEGPNRYDQQSTRFSSGDGARKKKSKVATLIGLLAKRAEGDRPGRGGFDVSATRIFVWLVSLPPRPSAGNN